MVRFLFFLLMVLLVACNKKKADVPNTLNEKILLIQTDKAFSEMCVERGMKMAFMEFIDSNGVLLKPNQLPIIGANAIDYLLAQDDTAYTLNWQPHNAFVSKSADLGYTYGVYALHPKYVDTVLYGTYVSIWKKQEDGKWKFILDSGNEGVDNIRTDSF